jgi:hypothetical protein
MTSVASPNKIFCFYTNPTSQFQIIRISNIPDYFFERTVIPTDEILFQTFIEAQIEVHTGMVVSAILSDVIPAEQLVDRHENSYEINLAS